jgi:hypothetical protein
MLIGMVGGAVGGAVGGWVGGGEINFGSVVAGAFAGGFVSGGLGTAFNGGNFFQNAMVGAIGSTVVAAAMYGVARVAGELYKRWNEMVGTPEAQAKTLSTSGTQTKSESQPPGGYSNVKSESSNAPPQPDSRLRSVGEVIPFPEGGRQGPRPYWMPADPKVLPFPPSPVPSGPFLWPEPIPLIVPNIHLFRYFLDRLNGVPEMA